MNNILENFYLYGTEFIKDHLASNPEYGAALIARDAAKQSLASTFDENQHSLYFDLCEAEDDLRDQSCAGAFAGGYRFRAMLSSAMFD